MSSDSGGRSEADAGGERPVPTLLCRVGARRYALLLEHVVETMRVLPLEPTTEAPGSPIGWSIIRDVKTPVVAIARLVGVDPSRATRLVTVKIAGRQIGLQVDDVLGVRALPAAQMAGWPPLLDDAAGSAGVIDSDLALVLNSARLLPESIASSPKPRRDGR